MTSRQPTRHFEVLDRIPDEEREVLILSSYYGLARDEIASIVGGSVEFVDGLLSCAREDLRLALTSAWSGSQAA